MASHAYEATHAVHHTLTATSVDTVTLKKVSRLLTITNQGATHPIYVTIGTAPATPTVGGTTTYVVLAGTSRTFDRTMAQLFGTGPVVVKLISTAAQAYSVEGY